MTDSDSVNPFAAPRQPALRPEPTIIDADPAIGDPIRYEATPTIKDLDSALRPVAAIILPVTLLSLLLFVYLIVVVVTGSQIVVLLFFLLCASLVGLDLFSKLYATEMHLRLNPNATAPLTGELTDDGLRLQSENRISWQPHDGLVFCQTKNSQLFLCHDPQGEAVKIIPIRGFQHPNKAIDFLEYQANKFSQPLGMLEPLNMPIKVGDPPADAIAFEGILKARDLKTSPLEVIRMGKFRRTAFLLMMINAVLLPVVFLGSSWGITMVVGGVIFLYDLIAASNILRSFLNSSKPEVPLIAIQGWLNEQEIALLHNIGQSRAGWMDFKSVGVNDACIWLEPYGGRNRFVLMPRRFFAGDTQWQTAARIAASHSTK